MRTGGGSDCVCVCVCERERELELENFILQGFSEREGRWGLVVEVTGGVGGGVYRFA